MRIVFNCPCFTSTHYIVLDTSIQKGGVSTVYYGTIKRLPFLMGIIPSNTIKCKEVTDEVVCGAQYAVKQYNKDKLLFYLDEVTCLNILRRDPDYTRYIPRIYYINRPNKIIAMELGIGDLFTFVKYNTPVSNVMFWNIAYRLLHIVKYIHSKSIVHLDIKPENIVYMSNMYSIRLIDFSHSIVIDSSREIHPKELLGTRANLAPEIQLYCTGEKHYHNKYLYKIDYWNVGHTLHRLLTSFDPVFVKSGKKVRLDTYFVKDMNQRDILRGLLTPNPYWRLDFQHMDIRGWFKDRNLLPYIADEI